MRHGDGAEMARRAEQAGARRSRCMLAAWPRPMSGAGLERRRARQAAVPIPVFGSGGVREPADAVRFLRETGADGVSIGRGCLGNPWIFGRARPWRRGSRCRPHP